MKVVMRRITLLVFASLMSLLVIACAATPATPGGEVAAPTQEPASTEGPAATPETTEPTTDTTEPTTPTGTLTWNADASQIVVQYNVGGGFRMAPTSTEIADFTLYGDGFVIWAQPSENPTPGFADQVMTGQLSPEQMQAVMDMLASNNIFGLEDEYVEMNIADAPSAVLTVNTTDETKMITVYPALSNEMPAEIQAIVQGLQDALPEDGTEYQATEFTAAADPVGNIAEMPAESQAFYVEWTVEGITLADLGSEGQSVTAEQAQAIAEFARANNNAAAENGVGYMLRIMGNPPREGSLSNNPPRA